MYKRQSLLRERGCAVTVTLRTYRHGETVVPAGCAVAVSYTDLDVYKRQIHTTADFEYADSLVFSAGAVEALSLIHI